MKTKRTPLRQSPKKSEGGFENRPEKAVDRNLLARYEADLDLIAKTRGKPEDVLRLAAWPGTVRGFGPVRESALKQATITRERARAALMA